MKEGVSQSKWMVLQLYEDEKEFYHRKIATFSKLIDNLEPTTLSFTENIIKYENTSDIMYQWLKKLNSKIEELLNGYNLRAATLKKAQKTTISTKEMDETKQIVQKLKEKKV